MEVLVTFFIFYLIGKALFGSSGSSKSKRRKKRNSWSSPTYSEYDAWRKSHGDENRLF